MTDSTKFKLLSAFKLMNQRITMTSFADRLILQKKVYLLQEYGLRLGNSYGWYIHGPYSRDVANDGFFLETVQDQINQLEPLSGIEQECVRKFKDLLYDAVNKLDKDEAYCLELLASLHFIVTHGYPKPKNKEQAIAQFTSKKPDFRKDSKLAMNLLENHGLV